MKIQAFAKYGIKLNANSTVYAQLNFHSFIFSIHKLLKTKLGCNRAFPGSPLAWTKCIYTKWLKSIYYATSYRRLHSPVFFMPSKPNYRVDTKCIAFFLLFLDLRCIQSHSVGLFAVFNLMVACAWSSIMNETCKSNTSIIERLHGYIVIKEYKIVCR